MELVSQDSAPVRLAAPQQNISCRHAHYSTTIRRQFCLVGNPMARRIFHSLNNPQCTAALMQRTSFPLRDQQQEDSNEQPQVLFGGDWWQEGLNNPQCIAALMKRTSFPLRDGQEEMSLQHLTGPTFKALVNFET